MKDFKQLKIGDTVYGVFEFDKTIKQGTIDVIERRAIKTKGSVNKQQSFWIRIEYEDGVEDWHTGKDIGTELFATKREAEARLRELQF